MTIPQVKLLIAGRATYGNNTVATERALWTVILNEACKLFEVKEIDINVTSNPTYFSDNFDNTGLGIGGMVGFAICNGNNGTRNRIGLTSIGSGADINAIGTNGGSKDAVLVSHKHTYSQYVESGSNSGSGGEVAGYFTVGDTSTIGESGVGKNMQPYIVTLMIQRIA